jgi:hypothetical protein
VGPAHSLFITQSGEERGQKKKYKVLFISNFSLADSPLEKHNSEASVNGRQEDLGSQFTLPMCFVKPESLAYIDCKQVFMCKQLLKTHMNFGGET